MKSILSFTLLLIFGLNHFLAQDFKKLPASYYLDKSGLEDGKMLKIKNLTHYDLYITRNSEKVKNLKGKEQMDFYKKAWEAELITLKQGNYYIDNEDFNFKFKIDKDGLLTDEGIYTNNDSGSQSVFTFLGGIAVQSVEKKNSIIVEKTSLTNDIFMSELFDKEGKLVNKRSINLKLGGGQANTISTHYKKGKVSSEQNNIEEGFISYYENGQIKRQTNNRGNYGKEFQENGKMISQYYTKNGDSCSEEYTEGLMESKKCSNPTEVKEYTYEKGKLKFYEVYNKANQQVKVYDAKGKISKKQPIMDKIPTIAK
ncbi:hypothetical protein [Kaistella jeonii]|nr:hypothetical protein [Kaistella jeonii]SFB69793.1 hypothetical protein SAMN05421876_101170 [Kaistella jeonii]VEI94769.1 Uncharacterised protein [Kaistella jeonii]